MTPGAWAAATTANKHQERHLSSRAEHLYKGSNIFNYLGSRLYALALR